MNRLNHQNSPSVRAYSLSLPGQQGAGKQPTKKQFLAYNPTKAAVLRKAAYSLYALFSNQ
jgi:hypothetical protein